MSEYFDDLLKATGNEFGSKVSDGIEAGDVSGYIDTGSYILNALISGDIAENMGAAFQSLFAD